MGSVHAGALCGTAVLLFRTASGGGLLLALLQIHHNNLSTGTEL